MKKLTDLPSRSIHVFISSTFLDMKEEREILAKQVFPQLKKLCKDRDVILQEIDLRWGITQEQEAEEGVLPICLSQIERCRPFFIGLLGERYGWVPENIPLKLAKFQPWLADAVKASITEIEMRHGVLNFPVPNNQAIFYLRDPAYVNTLPENQRSAFVEVLNEKEVLQYGLLEAQRRLAERKQKLSDLKQEIINAHIRVRKYAHPAELAQLVLNDFTDLINQRFPASVDHDPFTTAAADQRVYAISLSSGSLPRSDYLHSLDDFVKGNGRPLILEGLSGSGKSTLLAQWTQDWWDNAHPSKIKLAARVVHFVEATAAASTDLGMIQHLIGALNRQLGLHIHPPQTQVDEKPTLTLAFNEAARKGKTLIILDGVDHLDHTEQLPDLFWLPDHIPSEIRLIISTAPGAVYSGLEQRGWNILRLALLTPDEISLLSQEFLSMYGKSLAQNLDGSIHTTPACASPRFLRTLLEELRLHDDHETLGERARHYLAATSLVQLYDLLLARFEHDFDRRHPGLVESTCRLLWASRWGLTETELLSLLGGLETPLPQAIWAPFYLAFEPHLRISSGLIRLGNPELRQAIEIRYLYKPLAIEQSRTHLVNGLFNLKANERVGYRLASELVLALEANRDWDRLGKILSMPDLFNVFFQGMIGAQQALKAWSEVEAHTGLNRLKAYNPVLDNPTNFHPEIQRSIATFLEMSGFLELSRRLNSALAEQARQSSDAKMLAVAYGYEGNTLVKQGRYKEAESKLCQAEEQNRRIGDELALLACRDNLAGVYILLSDFPKATKLLRETEAGSKKLGLTRIMANSQLKRGRILFLQGEIKKSRVLLDSLEQWAQRVGDIAILVATLNSQAEIYSQEHNYNQAFAKYRQAEEICQEYRLLAELHQMLFEQSKVLIKMAKHDEALKLLQRAKTIARQVDDLQSLASYRSASGKLFYQQNRFPEALSELREAEKLARANQFLNILAESLGLMGVILRKSDVNKAIQYMDERQKLDETTGNQKDLTNCLVDQGLIQVELGNFAAAMALFKKQEQLARKIGSAYTLQACLSNQAVVLHRQGYTHLALRKKAEEEAICRKGEWIDDLVACLDGKAKMLLAINRADAALETFKEIRAIHQRRKDFSSLNRLAEVLEGIVARAGSNPKNSAAVLPFAQELVSIEEETGNEKKVVDHLAGLARLYDASGDSLGSLSIATKLEKRAAETGDKHSIAIALLSQAEALLKLYQEGEALRLAEKAYQLMREVSPQEADLRFKPLLETFRARARKRY